MNKQTTHWSICAGTDDEENWIIEQIRAFNLIDKESD